MRRLVARHLMTYYPSHVRPMEIAFPAFCGRVYPQTSSSDPSSPLGNGSRPVTSSWCVSPELERPKHQQSKILPPTQNLRRERSSQCADISCVLSRQRNEMEEKSGDRFSVDNTWYDAQTSQQALVTIGQQVCCFHLCLNSSICQRASKSVWDESGSNASSDTGMCV